MRKKKAEIANTKSISTEIPNKHPDSVKSKKCRKSESTSPPLKMLSISLTEKCNLNCKHCGSLLFRKKTGTQSLEELSRSEFQDLFDQMKSLGCDYAIFSGGEPFLRPDVWDILQDAENADISFSILTNGTLLNRRTIRRLQSYQQLDYVRLSLDYSSNKDVYRLRGLKRGADKILAVMQQLSDAGITVGVGMTMMTDNIADTFGIAQTIQKHGAKFLRAVPLIPVGKAAGWTITEQFFIDCIRTLLELKKVYEHRQSGTVMKRTNLRNEYRSFLLDCGGGSHIASVSAYGQVTICPIIAIDPTPLSIRESPLEQLLHTARHTKEKWQSRIRHLDSIPCATCKFFSRCKGGCIAEWFSRYGTQEFHQPFCLKSIWPALIKGMKMDKDLRRTINNMLFQGQLKEIWGDGFLCYRNLPFWTINFEQPSSGNN